MHTQISGRAPGTRSNKQTKGWIRITAWATRILAFLSIVFCILAFVINETAFAIFMIVTAFLSALSPLNFSSCCFFDCSRNTKTEKTIGKLCICMWIFISNMGYVIMFGYSWYFWKSSRYSFNYRGSRYDNYYYYSYAYYYPEHDHALLDTVFAMSLIITFFLSLVNLYSFCLVYKYGCCFMAEIDRAHSQQGVETAVVMNQQISRMEEGLPVIFPDDTGGAQETVTSPLVQYPQYQPYHAEPLCIAVPPQQAVSVTTDCTTSGQPNSPPPYARIDPIGNSSQRSK
ncbi:hypothetical protein MAR_034299 [Mya arenaria]|uniref:Uncharacterized protein n=1 Tax=Mya arenaria TaxID=6604 RepID=A0ABY7GCX1_MYAAR|nr:hypothetical protein MAR_034299 [Mya arenaria]